MSATRPARAPWGLLVLGLVALVCGLVLAVLRLPEWRRPPPRPERAVELVRRHLTAAGGTLTETAGRLRLASGLTYHQAFRLLGPAGAAYARQSGDVYVYRVTGELAVAGAGSGTLAVDVLPDGRFRNVEWASGDVFRLLEKGGEQRRRRERLFEDLRPHLLGESRLQGPPATQLAGGLQLVLQPLASEPGRPDECLVATESSGFVITYARELLDPSRAARTAAYQRRVLYFRFPTALVVGLLVLIVTGVFLARQRMSFRIGLRLGALVLGSTIFSGSLLAAPLGPGQLVLRLLPVLAVVLAWSAGEAVLRASEPGFTTSLDALLSRRLGPRAGRAVLSGLGLGALLAGLRLAAPALTTFAGGAAWPAGPSFDLPFFGGLSNPLAQGPFEAAELLIFVGLLRMALPRRGADLLGALLYALFSSASFSLEPWGAAMALHTAEGAVLLWALRAEGLTTLLVTATSAGLFRELLASALLLEEGVAPFGLGLLLLAALAALGVVGQRRSASEEKGRLELPDFVKRLESERRVQTEMGLLTRMQLALLPEKPPEGTGLDLAARTFLATEVGGDLYDFLIDEAGDVWVAAGDVSGHGYSCAIQQAMVKAALVSLVKAGSSPGAILTEVDRVLRTARAGRLFTSLVLIRVTPSSGRVVLANAGHPFPVVVTEAGVREVSAPGLPLGQGPRRSYEDLELELPRGGTIVIASDGLYEGPDEREEPYGYSRLPSVLGAAGLWRRPAEALVDALLADWRLHVGDGPPEDDTTVVAVRRPTYAP